MTFSAAPNRAPWPELDYASWAQTCTALHLQTQVVGKYRLAHTPWVNHSWHATLYVTARGLTTGMVPDGPAGGIEIMFDLHDHMLIGVSAEGLSERFALEPMSIATFYRRFVALLEALGATSRFDRVPNEIADPIAFDTDTAERPYDRDAVRRFHGALVRIDGVFRQFRTAFLGKVSPVHLFWGSFDLAVTRFSGRDAPLHPGGVPALPDAVTQEAYSHEVSSAGFWPGAGLGYPAFYCYAYPTPEGFGVAPIAPDAAFYDTALGEFILPYDAVRQARDPEAMLLEFLQTTYEAAADLAGWDRGALDCHQGKPRRPRSL